MRFLIVCAGISGLLAGCATLGTGGAPSPRVGAPVPIAIQETGGLWMVETMGPDGTPLEFDLNTGSGPALLYDFVAARLALRVDTIQVPPGRSQEPVTIYVTPLRALRPRPWIPEPLGFYRKHLIVSDRGREDSIYGSRHDAGYLGPPWFSDRTWTLDFPRRQLLLRAPGDLPADTVHRLRLGFKQNPDGTRAEIYPRIRVLIDGDSVDLLFATGNYALLTPAGEDALGEGPVKRSVSGVSPAVLDRWRARHPDWKFVSGGADQGMSSLIEVPTLTVAGHEVGPVWFESTVYPGHLRGAFDLPVNGALGANALATLRVTVDFRSGIAVFEH